MVKSKWNLTCLLYQTNLKILTFMKKVFCLTLMLSMLLSIPCFAQSQRSEREKAWRAERLRQRAAERAVEQRQDSVAYQAAVEALKEGRWVLEANNVNFANGITRFVSSSTNYISNDAGEGTIQTAYANFTYSPNGLGGVTLQGDIYNVSMTIDREGNVNYSFSIQGSGLSATVNLMLANGTNQASATVTPNFSGQSITFDGYLVSYDQSVVFQGMPWW